MRQFILLLIDDYINTASPRQAAGSDVQGREGSIFDGFELGESQWTAQGNAFKAEAQSFVRSANAGGAGSDRGLHAGCRTRDRPGRRAPAKRIRPEIRGQPSRSLCFGQCRPRRLAGTRARLLHGGRGRHARQRPGFRTGAVSETGRGSSPGNLHSGSLCPVVEAIAAARGPISSHGKKAQGFRVRRLA